jgi:excisionase family DNA binding protein
VKRPVLSARHQRRLDRIEAIRKLKADARGLLTVDQACARLGVHREWLRRRLRDGRIRGVRLGGARLGWRIKPSELRRWEKQQRATEGWV